jgi:tetratricopeptide (TPR) repeat protein
VVISSGVFKLLIKFINIYGCFILKLMGIFTLASVIMLANDALGDKVTARGSERDGVASMAFTWPTPVPFLAKIQNREIVIQFSRPAEGNFNVLAKTLSKYIGPPRVQNGGTVLIFPLAGNFDLNYFSRGRTVFVEVIDPNPVKKNIETKNQSSGIVTGQRALERVVVRVGSHSSYSRIVFDWKNRVKYKVAKRGNLVTVTFSKPANIIISALNRRGLANVRGAKAQISKNTTIVGLSVTSTSELKHFRNGPKVILDVLKSAGPNDAPPISTLVPKIIEKQRLALELDGKSKLGVKKLIKLKKVNGKSAKTVVRSDQRSAEVACPKLKLINNNPNSKKIKPATLQLDWPAPVAAAVFRRAGSLWMVFNKPLKVDVCKLREQGGLIFKSIIQETSEQATILRLVTVTGFNPNIRRNGFSWIFDFKKQALKAQTVIKIKAKMSSPRGSLLTATIRDVGDAIPFKDTKVYDNLFVVPVIPLGHGINKQFSYSQLNILPTAQGIVIQPNIDDLRVRSTKLGVEISADSNLALSTIRNKKGGRKSFGKGDALSRIIETKVWRKMRRQKPAEFYQIRREKLVRITKTKGAKKIKARLDMLLFLLGNGYGHEAKGVLGLIRPKSSDVAASRQFRFLQGATDFMMGRYKDSLKALMHPSMFGNDEGEYWRAAAKIAAGEDVMNAAKTMNAKGGVFRAYPRELKMRLGIRTTEAAIIVGDIKSGIKYLSMLAKEEPRPKEIDQLAFMEGSIKQMQGNFPGAIKAWQEVEKGEHRPSVAKSVLLRTDLLLTTKKIRKKEVIKELENLRFAWRGGEFEFSLLHKLGSLYLDVGEYRRGLRTLRTAVSNFRGHPKGGEITQRMEAAFIDLYLNDAADKIPPMRSLALFEEFKELTPTGKKGDKLIQKLADRLAAVDLLEKAAKLLEQQIEFRLTGVEKVRVGAQLAALYILDKKPGKALEALNTTNLAGRPESISRERRLLNSRSLIDLKRTVDALVPLEDDESREADLLRSEIYWGKNWPKAAKALQRLMVSTGAAPGRKLNEKQAQFVLNLGVALAYSGNNRGITRLSRDYLKEMDGTSFKDAFRLIASPDNMGLIDYRTVARRVKMVSNFKNFMSSYRKRLKDGNLSQVN